jgi:hypothetical protein
VWIKVCDSVARDATDSREHVQALSFKASSVPRVDELVNDTETGQFWRVEGVEYVVGAQDRAHGQRASSVTLWCRPV